MPAGLVTWSPRATGPGPPAQPGPEPSKAAGSHRSQESKVPERGRALREPRSPPPGPVPKGNGRKPHVGRVPRRGACRVSAGRSAASAVPPSTLGLGWHGLASPRVTLPTPWGSFGNPKVRGHVVAQPFPAQAGVQACTLPAARVRPRAGHSPPRGAEAPGKAAHPPCWRWASRSTQPLHRPRAGHGEATAVPPASSLPAQFTTARRGGS